MQNDNVFNKVVLFDNGVVVFNFPYTSCAVPLLSSGVKLKQLEHHVAIKKILVTKTTDFEKLSERFFIFSFFFFLKKNCFCLYVIEEHFFSNKKYLLKNINKRLSKNSILTSVRILNKRNKCTGFF